MSNPLQDIHQTAVNTGIIAGLLSKLGFDKLVAAIEGNTKAIADQTVAINNDTKATTELTAAIKKLTEPEIVGINVTPGVPTTHGPK